MFEKVREILGNELLLAVVLGVLSLEIRTIGLELGIIAFLGSCIFTTIYKDLFLYTKQYGIRLFVFNILQCIVFVITASVASLGIMKIIVVAILGGTMFIARQLLFYGENLKAMSFATIVMVIIALRFLKECYVAEFKKEILCFVAK